jgi:hypothetical protein
MNSPKIIFFVLFLTFFTVCDGQNSPLATGKWAKISTSKQGIYKLTGAQLAKLGYTLPIVSSQLQLFGYNLSNLTEKVNATINAGLSENSIKIMDGGDGQFDATDYLLFYNQGPVYWKFDSSLNRVSHQNYATGDSVYYFITLGQNGKRVALQNVQANNSKPRSEFSHHILFEKDSVSLLNSGKVFYGVPMGQGVGKQSQLNYNFNAQGFTNNSILKTYVNLASTSYQVNGQFDFNVNNTLVHSTILPTVSGLLFDDIAAEKLDSFNINSNNLLQGYNALKITYNTPNTGSTGWVDYIELLIKKQVGFWQDSTIYFSIEDEFEQGGTANCAIQNMDSSSIIWNITNSESPAQIQWQMTGAQSGQFINSTSGISNFFAVKQNAFEVPTLLGQVANQNTISFNEAIEYVIVAAPAYMKAALKYRQFQVDQFGRKANVFNAREIYNDFAGGQPSAVAIRNLLKYLTNRATQNNLVAPKFLLLLGIGNFNTKKLNIDFELPVYESNNSNSVLSSFSSDDFFSILNSGDDINDYNKVQNLSISVGRIPARKVAEADTVIQKLINYQTNKIGGSWENKITWVADDGDYNLHLQDAESIISNLQLKASHWNHNKIYLDLFPSQNTSAGNAYPLAFNSIQQAIQEGSVVLNYTGHGNYLRLSEEAVISQQQFELWKNANKLPLMIAASCNFIPYDQPSLNSIAWDAFMKNSEGIIGLVAANRLVYAFSNKQINDLFIQQLLVKNALGNYNTIGQALQNAKLINWSKNGDRVNDLKFNLMGDPGMVLNMPNNDLVLQKINDKPFIGNDTLLSGAVNKMIGTINKKGLTKSNFNGEVNLIIYDAIKYKKTLANQSSSISVPIAMQENVLFRGKATVLNGNFKIDFVLPAQVSNASSPIRIELAANGGNESALLILDSIYSRSNGVINNNDTIGPNIQAYINDPLFKQGGWVMPNSKLFINLNDSSGIQASGNALGHDLAIWLDDDQVPIILNNYYSNNINTYQSGKLSYLLPTLKEGSHKCVIKAWDLLGNSNADTLFFEVPKSNSLQIMNPINYPNPFYSKSRFSIETNLIGSPIEVQFEVLDPSGKLLYSNKSQYSNTENRLFVDWNGVTNSGANLKPGVYFYRFLVKTSTSLASISNTFIKL